MDRVQIADYLAKKVFNGELVHGYYFMLKNKRIYEEHDYGRLVKSNKISPEDTFVYFGFYAFHSDYESYKRPVDYLFPLIDIYVIERILYSYLAKLGFYSSDFYYVFPATGLKYFVIMRLFSDRLMIEIVDIDTVAINIEMAKIVADVLGKGMLTQKEISFNQKQEINVKLQKQKVFAWYDLDEAFAIINSYYVNHDTSLAKEVLAITNAYNRIFQPYRVVYDTRTRRQALM